MRVLIVDDEAPARARLRRMLAGFPDVSVVGEAADGTEALSMVRRLKPCAVFLDVQMPLLDGLGVTSTLPEPRPRVVFVTAYEQHAIDAFDADAADYLLKPVEQERLQRAVQRLRQPSPRRAQEAEAGASGRVVAVERGRATVIEVAAIEWLASEGNYVRVHAHGRSMLLRRTLADLLDDIGPSVVRIHRSTAVAVDRIRAVRARPKGDATIVLHGETELPCSRQYRALLMERLRDR